MAESPRVAAFFDLDKTIIAKSSTLAFSKPFASHGLLSKKALRRALYTQFKYVLAGADHDQMLKMRKQMADLVAGWKVEHVRSIVAETLYSVVEPLVFDEAVELIATHQAAGHDIVIVSASGADVVGPIGDMLGADHVIATTMEVTDEGHYSGAMSFYAYAENKAIGMREIAEREGYDLSESYAYSDSQTDVPMLEAVGHPFAVNPDKELRRVAVERGWPILDFTAITGLRSHLPKTPPLRRGATHGSHHSRSRSSYFRTAGVVGGALLLALSVTSGRRLWRSGARAH